MIEAFERHLKEHQFQKQFDKLETVEDRVKFCEDYIASHKPIEDFNNDFTNSIPTIKTINDATILTKKHTVSSSDLIDKPLNVIEKEIERQTIMELMSELISKGYVKLQRTNDPYNNKITYTMKLGVYKP